MRFSVTLLLEIHISNKIQAEEESWHEKETDLVFHEWSIQAVGLF